VSGEETIAEDLFLGRPANCIPSYPRKGKPSRHNSRKKQIFLAELGHIANDRMRSIPATTNTKHNLQTRGGGESEKAPSCCTDWRWPDGVRFAMVRATKTMNSLALERWKYPKWLTSDALARILGSDPASSPEHFKMRMDVIFIPSGRSLSFPLLLLRRPLPSSCVASASS
jgi:hypothetical protein